MRMLSSFRILILRRNIFNGGESLFNGDFVSWFMKLSKSIVSSKSADLLVPA